MLKRNLTSELVEKFNEALNKIIASKNEGNYDNALNLIDNTFKDIFRLSVKFFNSFSDENLIDMVNTDGTINADKCIIMAKLLEEEADVLEHQNKLDESFYINLKSLNLFIEAYISKDNNCDLQNYFSDIDMIIDKVSEYKISSSLQNKIIEYYIKANRYDKAEDSIYNLLNETNFNNDYIKSSIALYENLLLKSDEELLIGNLPREEIEDSLALLKKKLVAGKYTINL